MTLTLHLPHWLPFGLAIAGAVVAGIVIGAVLVYWAIAAAFVRGLHW